MERWVKVPKNRRIIPSDEIKVYSKDGVPIGVSGIVHYEITDPKTFVVHFLVDEADTNIDLNFDQLKHADHLRTQFTSLTRKMVASCSFNDAISGGISSEKIIGEFNRNVRDFGIRVIDITYEKIEPPSEFIETAKEMIKQRQDIGYYEKMSSLLKDPEKLLELVMIKSDKTEGKKDVEEKYRKKIRKLQALEESSKGGSGSIRIHSNLEEEEE